MTTTHTTTGQQFTPGQRVGIVTGVQSVSGPWVKEYGTVVRTVEFWKGLTEYVVQLDSDPTAEPEVYRAYLLRAA